ncbi:MAG TPA: c-type cytochrome [Gammaproteobacteria bacterium]|nr:c-type cytochrome [Gammaproteobacteria bacterium]
MKTRFGRTISMVVFLSIAWGSSAFGEPDGARLYAINCAACHGDRGDGGIGVPLSLPDFLSSVTDEYLFLTIRHGRPGRIMPSFQHLSDQQTRAIVRHIRNWAAGEPKLAAKGTPGDPRRGRDIFARHCARCHGPLGKGGTGTGVNFTRLHDQPVVAPGLNNAGFLAAASDRIIRTTLLKGRRGTPMQPAAKMGLSIQDVDDVGSYIRSFEKGLENGGGNSGAAAEPALITTSPLPFAETVERIKQAISARHQRIIREHPLDDGLSTGRAGGRKHLVIYFGNIRHINTLLTIDPRMGLFLPNRVTIMEQNDGKVVVSAVNPLRFRNLFNNANLEHTSREMHELYSAILGEVSE